MFDLFGDALPLPAKFFIAFAVVLALIGLTAWLVRRFGALTVWAAPMRVAVSRALPSSTRPPSMVAAAWC